MTYKVYFRNGSPAMVKGVEIINDYDTEYKFFDKDGNTLCIVNKVEYECILKVD